MLEIVGYISSILIGITLGLIGSGGSILTVPVLVYLLGVDVISATSYSLFIVGFTSALGSIAYFRKKLVNIRTAIVFGIPSIIGVFMTRAFILPAIPDVVFTFDPYVVTKSVLLLLIFAVLMIFSAYYMIAKNNSTVNHKSEIQTFNYTAILLEGGVVGIVTGLVGAGGGFLIIPALVLLSKLPMKEAVGTSLVIIASKSLIGFMGESKISITDWSVVSKVTIFASIGLVIGLYLSKKLESENLKPLFGVFLFAIALFIIIKETISILS